MKKNYLLLLLLACSHVLAAQPVSKAWVADQGDGTFRNPVLYADYSDPDAIRVGDDYYMTASSFNHVPGLPILHSKDLVNWTLIGHALPKLIPADHFSHVQHGGGVWAPSIRYHNNEFYIYYPDPDFGIYLIKAANIKGPWTEPVLVQAGKGLIDPCPFWDDNGKTYLVHAFAGSRAGIKSILVIKELNAAGTKVISEPVLIYDGHEKDPTIEGPKLYQRNGYYYIFAPAGGVSTGWQTVLRSKNIYGPYERKVVMDQGTTSINGPHQGAWVDTKTGEDWFLHFQDKEAFGRVVHLQPMKWVNDWPVIGIDKDGDGEGEPVLNYKKPNVGKTYPIQTIPDDDEFNGKVLGKQWQWQANPISTRALLYNDRLRLYSELHTDTSANLWNLPGMLLQKIPPPNTSVIAKMRLSSNIIGEKAGLILFGENYGYLSVTHKEDGNYISFSRCIKADKGTVEEKFESFKMVSDEVYFSIDITEPGEQEQLARFYFSHHPDSLYRQLGVLSLKPGRWVGAKIGFFCIRDKKTNDAGYADIDWIRFFNIEKK
ncbi:MAG: glycoside hydrolase 43 family protein [Bacteroidetes bacterium]|nr:glycoside hydrolase 43 family protein [Bacteroidota bacterium]